MYSLSNRRVGVHLLLVVASTPKPLKDMGNHNHNTRLSLSSSSYNYWYTPFILVLVLVSFAIVTTPPIPCKGRLRSFWPPNQQRAP